MALPRYNQNPDIVGTASTSAVGIICLGRESGKACFYDAGNVPANDTLALSNFLNGSNVSNGVCTDCHAGENPFIAHTDGPLDLGARTRSPIWYEPIIRADYIQNPGPSTLLEQVNLPEGQSSCLGCHNQEYAGRFPDILALNQYAVENFPDYPDGISDYCSRILPKATGGFFDTFTGEQVAPTMARIADPSDPNDIRQGTQDPAYSAHHSAIATLCQSGSIPPPEVIPYDPKDDLDVVSPPVIGPLYACSDAVEVRGGIYNANVTVIVNGTQVATRIVKQPNGFSVKVPTLAEGDEVQVSQTFDSVTASSVVVIVKSHYEDLQDGLPAPEIDPIIVHQCGLVVAVRHEPGVKLTLYSNGGNERKFSLGGDYSNLRPGKWPFELGDEFVAQQFLCDDASEMSNTVVAGEPQSLSVPELKNGKPIAGQPLLHIVNLPEGALTKASENNAGPLNAFSTAVTWASEVDVATGLGREIVPGDTFNVASSLCKTVEIETEPAEGCEGLPAPRIEQPLVGDTTVMVTSYVPGAQIQIYDEDDNEIADGSGNEVGLIRTIEPDDVLTVVQRLGNYVSNEAYRIVAICLDPELCN